jgi:hypothetical protein
MPDCYELLHACLDASVDDGSLDADSDGLTNLQEYLIGTDPCIQDTDGDGCTDARELAMGFDPSAWYDFYDVPVPASVDPTPSGPRNKAVGISDVLATLFYVGAAQGRGPNPNGVAYDSLKDGDWNGDTVINDADRVGLRYDRSPSALPNPPWDAGPPNGAVSMSDVLAVVDQVGLSCSGSP